MTHDNFEAFGFAGPVARALNQCGYDTPTPVQKAALVPQIEGRDLLALAETGSGKTAAFVLPILQELANNPANPNPREALSLILAPTRELALQIDQEVASLSRNMHIRRAVVLGGVSKGPQIHALKRGVHVLVATPGRLLDHVNDRHVDLRCVRTFVLDEADRMFDMGFIRDVRRIASLLSHKRRTAMLSATMPDEIRKLAHELLNDPYRIDLSPKQIVVDRIDQKVMIVRGPEKQSRLHTILKDENVSRVIVFTRTKRGADRVADRLGMAGIGAAAIHGNKAQNARQRALKDFSAGHVRVLVATDIAARGIDVSGITHVINFDMPMEPETYVHRIGRTARKGTSGIAISLCDPSERGEIKAIERLMKQPIEVIDDVGGEALPAIPRKNRDSGGERRNSVGFGEDHRGPARQRDSDKGERGGHRHGKPHRERDDRRSRERHNDFAISDEKRDQRRPAGLGEDRGGAPRHRGSDNNERNNNRHGKANHHAPRDDRRFKEHHQETAAADGLRHERGQELRQERQRGNGSHGGPHAHKTHHSRPRDETRTHHEAHRAQGEHRNRNHREARDNDSRTSESAAPQRWNGQRPPKFLNGSQPRRRNRSSGAPRVA
ncbi:MAG: DEAD/DEAH box helicase [Hyphomicrobiaceae bacterium]